MNRITRIVPIAALLTFFCLAIAASTTIVPPSLDIATSISGVVVEARVEGATEHHANGHVCGAQYSARVVQILKADRPLAVGTQIQFGGYSNLQPGRTYVLFIYYVSDTESVYEGQLSAEKILKESLLEAGIDEGLLSGYLGGVDRDTRIREIECDGLVPGYFHNKNLHMEVFGDEVSIFGLLPDPWPDSVTILRRPRDTWTTMVSKGDLFSYLRSITSSP